MKLNSQVLERTSHARVAALLAILFLLILFAATSGAAECPNHCSEERIDAYAALSTGLPPERRVERAKPVLSFTIQSVGYVCDSIISAAYTDLPGAAVWHVACNGGTLQYTVVSTVKRSVVYTGWLSL